MLCHGCHWLDHPLLAEQRVGSEDSHHKPLNLPATIKIKKSTLTPLPFFIIRGASLDSLVISSANRACTFYCRHTEFAFIWRRNVLNKSHYYVIKAFLSLLLLHLQSLQRKKMDYICITVYVFTMHHRSHELPCP